VKTVRRLLVEGEPVLVGTEVPQGAAHLLMGVIEALHGEVGEIAGMRPSSLFTIVGVYTTI